MLKSRKQARKQSRKQSKKQSKKQTRKQTRKQPRNYKNKLKRFTKKNGGGGNYNKLNVIKRTVSLIDEATSPVIREGSSSRSKSKYRKGGDDTILEKMFSTLSYINENGETYEIPIVTIPKGTILFRSIPYKRLLNNDYCGVKKVNDSTPKNQHDEDKGSDEEESSDEEDTTSSYCLHKNHNVFFYPYPGYSYNYGDEHGNLTIFVVKRNMKLVNLLLPSKYIRGDKHTLPFLKSCDKIEESFCDGLNGNSYDPCLTEHLLETHPDINGMYTIADMDTLKHYTKYNFLQDYSLLNRDRDNVGIPEIILYPFKEREIIEKKWNLEDCKKEENDMNYYRLDTGMWRISNTKDSSYYRDSQFQQIFHEYLSPQGNTGKHITIFSPLKIFVLWEDLPIEYKKDCVPIIFSWKSKLSQFQKDINKLNDPSYKKHYVVAETKDYTNTLYLERTPLGLVMPDESNSTGRTLLNNIKQYFQGQTHIPLKIQVSRSGVKSEINIVMLYNSINVGDIVYFYSSLSHRFDQSEEFYILDNQSRLAKMSSFEVPDYIVDSDYNTLIVPIDISKHIVTKGKSIKRIYQNILFTMFRRQKRRPQYSHKGPQESKNTRIIVEVDPKDTMLQYYEIKDKDLATRYSYGYHNDSWNPSLKVSFSDNSENLFFSSDELEGEKKYETEKKKNKIHL